MKTYRITFSYYEPYPKEQVYTVRGGNHGIAVRKAYDLLKQDRKKGKRELGDIMIKSVVAT